MQALLLHGDGGWGECLQRAQYTVILGAVAQLALVLYVLFSVANLPQGSAYYYHFFPLLSDFQICFGIRADTTYVGIVSVVQPNYLLVLQSLLLCTLIHYKRCIRNTGLTWFSRPYLVAE